MFVLKEGGEFEWPVDVNVPVSGGEFETQRFIGIFRPVGSDRMEEIVKDAPLLEHDKIQAREFFVGWKDVTDPDKKPVEYSEQIRDRMLGIFYVRTAIVRAYWDAMTGKKAATKN